MNIEPDLEKVIPISDMEGEDPEETQELHAMLKEARDYMAGFHWCKGVEEIFLGIGVGHVIAVFLFKIRPSKPEVDNWIWVIVGDLPSAYVTGLGNPNAASAVEGYIWEMRRWVKAAFAGEDVSALIPVNVPATPEYAEMLEWRLDFLERNLLPDYAEELEEARKFRSERGIDWDPPEGTKQSLG